MSATSPRVTGVRWSAAAVADAIGLPHRPTPEQTAVIEANQALLWAILTVTGTDWDVVGHGRLLRARHLR